jgi:hypothetical protein
MIGIALRAGRAGGFRKPRRVELGDADQVGRGMIMVDACVPAAEEAESDDADLQPPGHGCGSGMLQRRKSAMKAASSAVTAEKNALPASGLAKAGSPSVPVGERSPKS